MVPGRFEAKQTKSKRGSHTPTHALLFISATIIWKAGLMVPRTKKGSPTLGHTRDFHCRLALHGVKDDIEPKQPTSKKYSHALRHTRYFHHLRQKRLETR